nr:MAG TPA: hypothetical protein [Caudoviricetes sp.]
MYILCVYVICIIPLSYGLNSFPLVVRFRLLTRNIYL